MLREAEAPRPLVQHSSSRFLLSLAPHHLWPMQMAKTYLKLMKLYDTPKGIWTVSHQIHWPYIKKNHFYIKIHGSFMTSNLQDYLQETLVVLIYSMVWGLA